MATFSREMSEIEARQSAFVDLLTAEETPPHGDQLSRF